MPPSRRIPSSTRKSCYFAALPLLAVCLTPTTLAFSATPPQSRNMSTLTESDKKPAAKSDKDDDKNSLESVVNALENEWVRQLIPESDDNLAKSLQFAGLSADTNDNRTKRPVYGGHFVLVEPTGLPAPRLVLHSPEVAQKLLQLTKEQVESDDFVNWVSGNEVLGETWATPYALSIMGTRYTHNCPYGTGDGYGDGRAISIGQVHGYELQLKGGGKTPFHRGADGRAVLRSSIREFLASEAVHYLGVPTTRALSLVVSEEETIQRPWYSDSAQLQLPGLEDPRLAKYSLEERQDILRRLRNTQKADPNILVREKAAITCRVASSFTRIGHLDLFARRATKASQENGKKRFDTSTQAWKELEAMVWHACYREYRDEAYTPFKEKGDIAAAATAMLDLAAERLAKMVAGWVRIGFAQGNFNADNCLVGGKTMDYGPFGWMEEYNPVFAKWTGSGEHFGFMNQPTAGYANYAVLVESVVPVICAAKGIDDPTETGQVFLDKARNIFEGQVDIIFRSKLGFAEDQDIAEDVWLKLEPLLRKSQTDWTLFWRQLTYVARDFADYKSEDYEGMLTLLERQDDKHGDGASPFYEPLAPELRKEWLAWMEQWRTTLASATTDYDAVAERMRMANPKYVLREWMLVDAYNGAAKNEEAELFYLYNLIQRPYEEGSDDEERKYYRRASDSVRMAGGTAFMS